MWGRKFSALSAFTIHKMKKENFRIKTASHYTNANIFLIHKCTKLYPIMNTKGKLGGKAKSSALQPSHPLSTQLLILPLWFSCPVVWAQGGVERGHQAPGEPSSTPPSL